MNNFNRGNTFKNNSSSREKGGQSSQDSSSKGYRPNQMLEVIEQLEEDTKINKDSLMMGEDISRLEGAPEPDNSQDRSGILSEGMSMFNY